MVGLSRRIRWFVQETGASWPILTAGGSVFSAYQAVSTPTVYVISPAGTVASSSVYPTNAATLKSTIDALEGRAPAACAQTANSFGLFAKGTNDALWWKHWDGTTWTASKSLGGVLTAPPAATSPSNGAIDVFVRGSTGALYEKTTTNGGASWSSWSSLGGQLSAGTGPAADARGPNSLDVFVQGTDHALWYKHWDGTTWSAWKSLGGVLTSSPAAASQSSGAIAVFARGSTGALYEKTTTNNGTSWSSWSSLGGKLASGTGPAVDAQNANSLDVFVQGTDNALWHKSLSGSAWSAWGSLGGKLTSSPAATSPASGVIDVFVAAPTTASGRRPITVGGPAGRPSAAYNAIITCPRCQYHDPSKFDPRVYGLRAA